MVLDTSVTEVFTNDGYSGIAMLELDWDQNVIWERGNLNDGYSSIEEHFKCKEYEWYISLSDCVACFNPFIDIDRRED